MKNELLEKLSKQNGYQKQKQRVKLCNGNLLVWLDDNNNIRASSYDHWTFIINIDGIYYFNWYKYSNTTSKHQYTASRIMRELGLSYITVETRDSLSYKSPTTFLNQKLEQLYTGENALSLSRATKYAVYSETAFNGILDDIRTIAKSMKLSEKELDKMLLDAETNATLQMLEKLCDKLELENTRKEYSKQVESLEAIAI